MHDEKPKYLRHGYVFLIAALPTLISLCRELIVGLNFGRTFWDTAFSFQLLGIISVLGLLTTRRIGYLGAIVFQVSHYFWVLGGIYSYYFIIKRSSGVDTSIFFFLYFRPSSIVMSNNPFAPLIAVQGAFLLIQRYNVFIVEQSGKLSLSILKIYRIVAIAALMNIFSNSYVHFTVYPWLRYRYFHDFLWLLYLIPIVIIVALHQLCKRSAITQQGPAFESEKVDSSPRQH